MITTRDERKYTEHVWLTTWKHDHTSSRLQQRSVALKRKFGHCQGTLSCIVSFHSEMASKALGSIQKATLRICSQRHVDSSLTADFCHYGEAKRKVQKVEKVLPKSKQTEQLFEECQLRMSFPCRNFNADLSYGIRGTPIPLFESSTAIHLAQLLSLRVSRASCVKVSVFKANYFALDQFNWRRLWPAVEVVQKVQALRSDTVGLRTKNLKDATLFEQVPTGEISNLTIMCGFKHMH